MSDFDRVEEELRQKCIEAGGDPDTMRVSDFRINSMPGDDVVIDIVMDFKPWATTLVGKPNTEETRAEACDKLRDIMSRKKCPACGSAEIDAMMPRTLYGCDSGDYNQRPGTFRQSPMCVERCNEIDKKGAL